MSDRHIFDVIEQLLEATPLTPDSVATLLGAPLARDRESDTAAFESYALKGGGKGRYETVDLRMPDEDIGDGMVFLSVTMAASEGVDETAITERFGLDFRTEVPSPRYKPGSVPTYLIYERDPGSLSFGVTADDQHALVRFVLSTPAAVEAEDGGDGDGDGDE